MYSLELRKLPSTQSLAVVFAATTSADAEQSRCSTQGPFKKTSASASSSSSIA